MSDVVRRHERATTEARKPRRRRNSKRKQKLLLTLRKRSGLDFVMASFTKQPRWKQRYDEQQKRVLKPIDPKYNIDHRLGSCYHRDCQCDEFSARDYGMVTYDKVKNFFGTQNASEHYRHVRQTICAGCSHGKIWHTVPKCLAEQVYIAHGGVLEAASVLAKRPSKLLLRTTSSYVPGGLAAVSRKISEFSNTPEQNDESPRSERGVKIEVMSRDSRSTSGASMDTSVDYRPGSRKSYTETNASEAILKYCENDESTNVSPSIQVLEQVGNMAAATGNADLALRTVVRCKTMLRRAHSSPVEHPAENADGTHNLHQEEGYRPSPTLFMVGPGVEEEVESLPSCATNEAVISAADEAEHVLKHLELSTTHTDSRESHPSNSPSNATSGVTDVAVIEEDEVDAEEVICSEIVEIMSVASETTQVSTHSQDTNTMEEVSVSQTTSTPTSEKEKIDEAEKRNMSLRKSHSHHRAIPPVASNIASSKNKHGVAA